jgi:hypothetical protein
MGLGAAALGALGRSAISTSPAQAAVASATSSVVVWVWQFDRDGLPNQIRADLARGGMGIALKTHDGTSWMSRWDKNENAVNGPWQVERLAAYFGEWGVPFHAWCVITGIEPYWEAKMCSEVLDAGAQSLYLDVEASDGSNYWRGTPEAALEFGHHLRSFQPDARIVLTPDARPWNLKTLPIAELASISNAIAPQAYWRSFDSPANYRRLGEHGYSVNNGVTPELISLVSHETFARFGLPLVPIGQGNADPAEWDRFINASQAHSFDTVSVWRYGTTTSEAFEYLVSHARGRLPARLPEPEAPVVTPFVPASKALNSRGWLNKRRRGLGLLD